MEEKIDRVLAQVHLTGGSSAFLNSLVVSPVPEYVIVIDIFISWQNS